MNTNTEELTRRSFLKLSATIAASATVAAQPASSAAKSKPLPVGLELYSVRDEMTKDVMGTLRAVAGMGYEVVEFYAPYLSWTPVYAGEVRRLLDELHMRCLSTHNGRSALEGDRLKQSIELNQILGSKTLVMASSGISSKTESPDAWKKVAETLTKASDALKPMKMRVGYHNHQLEFIRKDDFAGLPEFRPMPFLAANTPKDVTLQFDVGTCMEAGFDPLEWIKANPGRIRSLHLKDWGKGPGRGYKVLFSEGDTPWAQILDLAQSKGGAECLLIEQEGSRFSSLETVQKCLENYRKLRPNG